MNWMIVAAVNRLCDILILLLLARAVMSWVMPSFGIAPSGLAGRLYATLLLVTEPLVAPCRRLLSRFNTGMFDFSLLVATMVVILARNVISALLLRW